MSMELILFIVMVAVFVISCFTLKLPVSIAMVLSAVAGNLVAGNGLPIRHLVEGSFAYIDTILVISTAMIFMKIIQEIGALNSLTSLILRKFHKTPVVLLILLMFISMFPGMITGSSTASVLTAGSIVAPIFMILGIPALDTAAIIAMGGLCGMIAPPVNVPAMIIGGGIDMPFVGFTIPLLLLTIPVAIFSVLYLGRKYVKNIDYNLVKEKVEFRDVGIKLYLPIIAVVFLMVADKVFPRQFGLGMPLIFIIGSIIGIICGKKINIIAVSQEAIKQCLPVLGILMGVGMFIQTMTLIGVRGFVVVRSLSLPETMLFLAMAVTIPLFGAVSSFGASSVLGVPFLMAFLAYNQIITASSISFIAALGDLMPPTALAGIFAAQVVGLKDYSPVLKKCLIPSLVIIVYSIIIIIFSKQIGQFIF